MHDCIGLGGTVTAVIIEAWEAWLELLKCAALSQLQLGRLGNSNKLSVVMLQAITTLATAPSFEMAER